MIKAGGAAALGASAFGLFPRLLTPAWANAAAFTGITLDPTIDPLLQGYDTHGTAPYTPGSRLAINDNSGAGGRVFFAPARGR